MKILASLWGSLIYFLLDICAQFQIENYFFLGNSHSMRGIHESKN